MLLKKCFLLQCNCNMATCCTYTIVPLAGNGSMNAECRLFIFLQKMREKSHHIKAFGNVFMNSQIFDTSASFSHMQARQVFTQIPFVFVFWVIYRYCLTTAFSPGHNRFNRTN